MGFLWNPINEPIFKAAPKLLLTEFGLRGRLESSEGPLELEEVDDVTANRAGTLTIRQNNILLVFFGVAQSAIIKERPIFDFYLQKSILGTSPSFFFSNWFNIQQNKVKKWINLPMMRGFSRVVGADEKVLAKLTAARCNCLLRREGETYMIEPHWTAIKSIGMDTHQETSQCQGLNRD